MPYPDRLLADDEEVVAHLHPHALTVFWPVVRLLLVVGAASFAMAMVPAGSDQGGYRLGIVGVALLLLFVAVVRPLMRWKTTHYVITTHRLLWRTGVLTRRGRDIALGRITDVSFVQTLWERVIRSGTLAIESAGEGGPTVLARVPGAERVQQLLNHMIEEDADRRAQESAAHLGAEYRNSGRLGYGTGGWGTGGVGPGGWGSGGFPTGGWGTTGQPASGYRSHPV